jgi:hypothetical protein
MAASPIVDDFLECLVGTLACRGTTRIDVDDPRFLKALGETYLALQARIDASRDQPDDAWTDFLIEVRDVFKPGLLGTHARFGEALLRARCIRSRAPTAGRRSVCRAQSCRTTAQAALATSSTKSPVAFVASLRRCPLEPPDRGAGSL